MIFTYARSRPSGVRSGRKAPMHRGIEVYNIGGECRPSCLLEERGGPPLTGPPERQRVECCCRWLDSQGYDFNFTWMSFKRPRLSFQSSAGSSRVDKNNESVKANVGPATGAPERRYGRD
ncbi:hypothetical protein E2C01_091381 [Portunus trituberculatus]|uniref:Uncharacterized protein n=1 Tax=Portunus trituberculatus TaxID=210409 RepID=A0A5B7JSS4_PORTR|nr:hypothetical protein [Portunus trituberculatus]